jgi:chitin deacetylase
MIRIHKAWSSGFPKADSDLSTLLPALWKEALDSAIEAGKIPNIPASNNTPGTNPVYPAKVDPNSPDVCSATYKCRHPDDMWDAPDGVLGSGFDDGPQPVRTRNHAADHRVPPALI